MLKETLWYRLSRILGWTAVGSIFALVIFMANIEIRDLDIWLHLAMGKFIVQQGYVPQVDVLSATIAGRPWINHEWLFQIIVHQLFSGWGADGLITMQVILVTLTLTVLLLLGYDRERQWLALSPLLLVVFVYQERLTYRPDLFSLLFLASFLFFLSKKLHQKWLPVALFILQVFWVNVHGFFILGPLLVFLWWAGEEFNSRIAKKKPLPKADKVHLRHALVLVVLACFINPMGWKGALYPFDILSGTMKESRIFFQYIGELEPPVTWATLFSGDQLAFKALIALSALLLILNYRRLNLRDVLIWVIFLLLSLSARRNVVLFAFTAFWVIVTYGDKVKALVKFDRFSGNFKLAADCLVKFLIIVFVLVQWEKLSLNGYYDFDNYRRKSEVGGISLRMFPHKAADFLLKAGIHGNFYNDFNSGAYLLGRCYPNIRVAIDGRTELYGAKLFMEHDRIWKGDTDLLKEWVQRYDLKGIMLGSVFGPIPQALLWNLSQDKEWVLVYFDHDGVIFLKDSLENRELIKRYAVSLDEWRSPQVDLERVGLRRVEPFQQISRAYSLASMRRYDQALSEGFEALRLSPNSQDAYKIVGYCFLKKGNSEEAYETLRMAAVLDPADKEVRYNLAAVYEQKGEFEKALHEAALVLRDPAGKRLAVFLIARILAKTDKFHGSVQFLRRLDEIIPADWDDFMQIGDIIYDKGDYKAALEVYEMALLTGRHIDKIQHKIELCYRALEKKDR